MSWRQMRLVVQVYAEEQHGMVVRERMRIAKELEDAAASRARGALEG